MTTKKSKPFKQLYCSSLRRLLLIPASAVKVWFCHFNHEGQERTSHPSVPTICKETALNKTTVGKSHTWLVRNGWLKKVGEKPGNGRFPVPVYTATLGTVPATPKTDKRRQNRIKRKTVDEKSVHGKPQTKKSSTTPTNKSFADPDEKIVAEVDSSLSRTNEVDGASEKNLEKETKQGNQPTGHSPGGTTPPLVAAGAPSSHTGAGKSPQEKLESLNSLIAKGCDWFIPQRDKLAAELSEAQ